MKPPDTFTDLTGSSFGKEGILFMEIRSCRRFFACLFLCFCLECPTVVDVVFMVDYSNTISRREAQDTKLFIKSVVLHPNPSKEGKTGVPSSSWSTKKIQCRLVSIPERLYSLLVLMRDLKDHCRNKNNPGGAGVLSYKRGRAYSWEILN